MDCVTCVAMDLGGFLACYDPVLVMAGSDRKGRSHSPRVSMEREYMSLTHVSTGCLDILLVTSFLEY